jgi:OPT oligopeptide transporter protein
MVPVMFGGIGYIPPAVVYNYLCWGIVGFIFQFYIRRRYFGWFKEYNYVTAAALDTGLILSTIVIFLHSAADAAKPAGLVREYHHHGDARCDEEGC